MIKMIVAMDDNRVIGIRGGAMPWGRGLKDDLQYFKSVTEGNVIVMGRKTFTDDLKRRPLKNRVNMVLTRNDSSGLGKEGSGVVAIYDFRAVLLLAEDTDVWVIGGAEVYALAMPHAREMHITRVHGSFPGDVLFPEYDESEWFTATALRYGVSERNTHAFTIERWIRRKI
jgi:dihydrofolate reductase